MKLLRCAWLCWFRRRRLWKLACAASLLAAHGFNTSDDALYAFMAEREKALWAKVYEGHEDLNT